MATCFAFLKWNKSAMLKFLSNRNIATFYLVLFCIQFVPLEGYGVSTIKVGVMCIAPLIMLLKTPVVSKATLFGGLYLLWVFFCAYLQWSNPRIETMGYLAMFAVMFIMFYNLVYSRVFTIDYFIRFLRVFIYAFALCLIGQQLCMLAGIHDFPVFNLQHQHFLSLSKLPSLAIEPSHTARILAVLFLAYLKCNEYKDGAAIPIIQLFRGSHKWVTYGFLWTMITMGSGTAFIALGILCVYFIKKKYAIFIIPMIPVLYFFIPMIDYEPLNRARVSIEVTMSGVSDNVIEADGSAAARIVPILNTINDIDLTNKETWFGKGVDTAITADMFSAERKIGGITDYGLASWILALIFVFICCIRRVFSIETMIFLILLGANFNNIAYIWGILMIFTVVKYFDKSYSRRGGFNEK
jgi:hypothetical protein